jgi:hypothetical protein
MVSNVSGVHAVPYSGCVCPSVHAPYAAPAVATSLPVVSVMYLGHSHSLWYASLLWWGHGE